MKQYTRNSEMCQFIHMDCVIYVIMISGIKSEQKIHRHLWYNGIIIKNKTLEEMVEFFIKKGGRINKYYLQNPKRGPSLVFYKGWYSGKNIRDAITRALAG